MMWGFIVFPRYWKFQASSSLLIRSLISMRSLSGTSIPSWTIYWEILGLFQFCSPSLRSPEAATYLVKAWTMRWLEAMQRIINWVISTKKCAEVGSTYPHFWRNGKEWQLILVLYKLDAKFMVMLTATLPAKLLFTTSCLIILSKKMQMERLLQVFSITMPNFITKC